MFYFFFFNDAAPTELYTLSLHDALPISRPGRDGVGLTRAGVEHRPLDFSCRAEDAGLWFGEHDRFSRVRPIGFIRSEEHTSELQSHVNLVCRLLLEKKKKKKQPTTLTAS